MTTATAAASSVSFRLLGAPWLALADLSVRGICRALSKVSRVTDGGVFRHPNGSAFLGCWREQSNTGGSVTLRLGRVEVCADYRHPA
ncbi:hypothetical protein [Ideonella sp. B508-1]|uniref:hypothetical protein n=1 Tax=Ideonella sp. B508-1 TaxID=137716 RepID=UPI0003B44915|nr:hypothetical protein [Ideonella sp. B508-1]